ncbi:hypothetical protein AJ467_06495 [Campylobacter coli]|uniref:hypothetical protein n=1 Tax=Campylobacter coli TaxID=195 RepID=UPI000874F471|nr:hypothetical protein [Campylobacter coli]OEV80997.1 hypothetical protein AJ467_06495 [Campylobacter coli]OEV82065.1 hypothetical protein AJO33_09715 [Campylobacter coli]OEV82492.1 hypothetical protein AJO35_01735 [Campylobacter coli]OEV84276.1 hypothetical protein AJ468_08795 [Campylobacter coli]OEW82265.1 hypothetical protein A0L90_09650 [Campylobacter coli]
MIVLIFQILGFFAFCISVIAMFFNPPLGVFFLLLASLLAVVGMTIGEGNTINLSYPIMEWIWSVGKYVLVIFAIMMVFAVVLELIKKIKSNKRVNKGMDIKNKGEQNPKILIIDNTMEDLLALKKESLYEE